MKIGILTFHRPVNYGAFLQAFALSNKIQSIFEDCTVEIIDYIAPKEKRKIYLNVLRRIKRRGLSAGYNELIKIRKFRESINNLQLSKQHFCTDDLNCLYDYINKNYDALVIGSDAVFNWNQNGYPTAFIPNYNFTIPVITYAASVHGLKYYEEPQKRINECAQVFRRMNDIYVRDLCTEEFVKFCSDKTVAKHSCDPTFLMDFERLYSIPHRSIEMIKKQKKIRRNYIVLMLQNDEISRSIYEHYHSSYDVISLFVDNKYSDIFLADLTPIEWCLVLKNAKCVITSYFHGTLLSLQQGIPAVVVDVSHYNGIYEGKLDDLMNRRLLLPELYFSIDSINSHTPIIETIKECLYGVYSLRIAESVISERKSFNSFLESFNALICK